jgi:hypothetical protein
MSEIDEAFMAWMKKDRPIDEVPGSEHERLIAWYAFREGWEAGKASVDTGPSGSAGETE